MSNDKNATDNTNLALVNTNTNLQNVDVDKPEMFIPQNVDQLNLLLDLQNSMAKLDSLGIHTTKSQDLAKAGTVFHITDSFVTTSIEIVDGKEVKKDLVIFKLIDAETGEEYTVVKSGNSINKQYADGFSKTKAFNVPLILKDYMFKEEPKYTKRGNAAVILVRAPKQVKNITPAK